MAVAAGRRRSQRSSEKRELVVGKSCIGLTIWFLLIARLQISTYHPAMLENTIGLTHFAPSPSGRRLG
jgi:hypothetical protein